MNLWESINRPSALQTFVFLMAISGVAVSGAALAAGRLLRHRSPSLRYAVLFGAVVGLLAVPVLVGVGQSLSGLFAVTTEETVRVPAEQVTDLLAPPTPPIPVEPASVVNDVASVVPVVGWAIGIAFGLLRLVRGIWTQRRAFVAVPWQPEWWTDERRRALAQKVGLRRFPEVCRSPCAPLPMVVGLWPSRIVLPESAPAPWSQPQWEAILLHEAAHIARRDAWAALAQRLAVVFFWWCPFVHHVSRRLNVLRETICDDYALEGPCDHIAYAELLVETAERLVNMRTLPVPVGLLDAARVGLEERITSLLEKEKQPMTKLSLAAKLFGAAALVAACVCITAATAFSQAPPAQKKIQIKIIVDGKEIDLSDEVIQAVLAAQTQKASNPKALKLERATGPTWQVKPAVTVRSDAKPDPRIEDLVKQAEDIRPGSGAAVRKALQGAAVNWKFEKLGEDKMKKAKALADVVKVNPAADAKRQVQEKLDSLIKTIEVEVPTKVQRAADGKRQALEKRLEALAKELEELRRELQKTRQH
jgi:beta-lactamase regulating signal transducer with metallopeptidase domain